MSRPVLTILLMGTAVALGGNQAAGSPGPDLAGPSAGSSATQAVCTWKWKHKRVHRWIKTDGKWKRVVRYKVKKVRVCRKVNLPDPAPARLGVRAFEFGFTLSATSLDAGDTIIELNNRGEDGHDLHLVRLEGGAEMATPETAPSQTSRIRLVTSPGTYRLWCSLPTHAEKGMDTEIAVR